MADTRVRAPISLLREPSLTPAAKVLWLTLRAFPTPDTPARLAANSGLALTTVRSSLAQLQALAVPEQPAVSIPVGLLPERRVPPRAKLLYGILQTVPGFRDPAGAFTYKSLSARAQVSVRSLPQLVRALAETGWIQATQANQLDPIQFSLRIPEVDRRMNEVADAKRRLEESDFRGEAIMREYLTLLIDSDEFEDNARPGFLVNPQTGERMELDRYYPPVAGFEFQGPQHYRTTQRFPSEKALIAQQTRDLIKEALCARRGVRVVVINPEDLNLATMQQKVGHLLPLRALQGHEELIQFLERAGKAYQD